MDIIDMVKLWILRLLVPFQGHREFLSHGSFGNDALAEFVGLGEWVDCMEGVFAIPAVLSRLKNIQRECEKTLRNATAPQQAVDNLARLASLAGLSETECRILEFAAFLHTEPLLEDTADYLGQFTSGKVSYVLAGLLDIPETAVRAALSPTGGLASSGLLSVERDGQDTLKNKLKLISDRFAETLLYSDGDPISLLRDIVFPGSPATLHLDDYEHIRPSLDILLPYLRRAVQTRRPGVNILLYGKPGTGKSELARLLAGEMGCDLFEVASEDQDGDPVGWRSRLQAFRAAQSFFSQRSAMLLFDEVEDVFDAGEFSFMRRREESHKAWINRVLENNRVPALWVSNSVACVDSAFLRRFDVVIELPIPSRRQRERIIHDASGGILPEATIRKIADMENLSPAVITRAVAVVESVRDAFQPEDVPKAVERLIGNTLKAQGYHSLKSNSAGAASEAYDPACIHADSDPIALARGLARTRTGRLCLYGPPGTGKTAFGRWLAQELDVPLCVKKGSDLISKWVGETEKNIAEAFSEAERDGALLLIDEVDSFLQDRRRAHHSWEVTAVNEMLTQMESFEGVFIASTNLMDGLDQASLRRFDLKMKFDFLRPDQAWHLFLSHCKALSLAEPSANLRQQIAELSVLTPGDFAAVARQNRFRPIEAPSDFLLALEQECLVKEDGRRKTVGFFGKHSA